MWANNNNNDTYIIIDSNRVNTIERGEQLFFSRIINPTKLPLQMTWKIWNYRPKFHWSCWGQAPSVTFRSPWFIHLLGSFTLVQITFFIQSCLDHPHQLLPFNQSAPSSVKENYLLFEALKRLHGPSWTGEFILAKEGHCWPHSLHWRWGRQWFETSVTPLYILYSPEICFEKCGSLCIYLLLPGSVLLWIPFFHINLTGIIVCRG